MASEDDLDWLYRREPDEPRAAEPGPSPEREPRQALQGWSEPRQRPDEPPASHQRREPPADPGIRSGRSGRDDRRAYATPVPPLQPAPPRRTGEPRPPAAARPRRRHPARTLLVLLLLAALLVAGYVVGVPLLAWSRVGRVANTPDGNRPDNQPGTTFLLVGSDASDGLTPEEAADLGVSIGGEREGSRTDTMMLVYVPPQGKPVIISLPRDSYVPIPGHGSSKLNAAYAWGGPQLLTQTVEQATGLRIDGYAEVGFVGFARVVQALGGLDICVQNEVPAEDDMGVDIKPGCQTLDAKAALWFVRSRHAAVMQDLDRIERQRQFMAAVFKQVVSPAVVLNPPKYYNVSTALASGLKLGDETTMGDGLALLQGMRTISQGGGYSLVVPISNPDATTDAGSSVLWDKEAARALFAQLATGDTSNLERFKK